MKLEQRIELNQTMEMNTFDKKEKIKDILAESEEVIDVWDKDFHVLHNCNFPEDGDLCQYTQFRVAKVYYDYCEDEVCVTDKEDYDYQLKFCGYYRDDEDELVDYVYEKCLEIEKAEKETEVEN